MDAGTRDGIFPVSSTYWNRVKWLNRNPGYGFGYWAIGVPFIPVTWKVIAYQENPHYFKAISKDGNYCIRFIKFGILFKIGYKAWNMFDKQTGEWKDTPWGPEWRVPYAFSISKAK